MKKYDAIIIGAGASGLMCATSASKEGKKVALIEKQDYAGKKIKVSGGGKSNFTNKTLSFENYISDANTKFLISVFSQFSNHDLISMVEKNKIKYFEKEKGQLFCSNSSMDILNMLFDECKKRNVYFHMQENIADIKKENNEFIVKTNNNIYKSKSLVIATGGLSYQHLGASDFGHKLAKKFGIKTTKTTPALTSLIIKNLELNKLAGISLDVKIKYKNKDFSDMLLFTHKGISGPAILRLSSYFDKGDEITINLLPNCNVKKHMKEKKEMFPKKQVKTILSEILPKRLAIYISNQLDINKKLAEISNKDIEKICDKISNFKVKIDDFGGYNQAEATKGGVDISEINTKTFESKKVKNLFFVGEVLDVLGDLGGYNLQFAWSSGYIAGKNL